MPTAAMTSSTPYSARASALGDGTHATATRLSTNAIETQNNASGVYAPLAS